MAVILHVNDDEAARYTCTRPLQQAGHVVREARSCHEALQQLRSHVDLILLDIVLPDGNGLDLCRQLKADPATQSIPIITASAVRPSAEESRRAGADTFLFLPVDQKELLAEVARLLQRPAPSQPPPA